MKDIVELSIEELFESGLIEFYVIGTLSYLDQSKVENLLTQNDKALDHYEKIEIVMKAYAEIQAIVPNPKLEQYVRLIIKKLGSKTPIVIQGQRKNSFINLSFQRLKAQWKTIALPLLIGGTIICIILLRY